MPDATVRPADPLRQLGEARRALEQAQAQVRDGVAAARDAGRSWADVGEALGVSRQAAFKRFASPKDPRTGDPMTPTTPADVSTLTERVLRLLDAGDTDTLTALMAPAAAAVLRRDLLLDTWAGAVAETGALVAVQAVTVHLPEPDGTPIDDGERVLGTVVGRAVLVCEAGEWAGRVAVDLDGRVVGLLVVPVDATDLPF